MLNKGKIRAMTKLAVYDKNFGGTDKKRAEFFKWDYVYFKNFNIRLGVLTGCIIIAVFYMLKKVLVDNTDILTMDIRAEITKIIFYIIVTLIVYTVIGIFVYGKEYELSKMRLENYTKVLMMFERHEESKRERKDTSGEASKSGSKDVYKGAASAKGSAPPYRPEPKREPPSIKERLDRAKAQSISERLSKEELNGGGEARARKRFSDSSARQYPYTD